MPQTALVIDDAARATQVAAVLVAECGLDRHGAELLIDKLRTDGIVEHRIGGALGPGGKLICRTSGPVLRVDCYPEHLTADVGQRIRRANDRLAALTL